MSAEILRRAASLMRERAEAADADDHMWRDDVSPLLEVGDDTFTHAASWHPAVALAVADWLDLFASIPGIEPHFSRHFVGAFSDAAKQALAVARAYLGESA